MLETVRQMERDGQWLAIRQLVPQILAAFDGTDTDRARLHLFLVTAISRTADGVNDIQLALRHAHLALKTSPVGSMVQARSFQKLASLYVNLGRPADAKRYALAYLVIAPQHPKLAVLTPWVIRDLSHVAYQSHQFQTAIALRRRACAMYQEAGNIAETTRTQLSLVWAYVRARQARNARSVLPKTVPSDMVHLLHGATAAVLALEGRWAEAYAMGRNATQAARIACDYTDAAEVCLILAQVARHLNVQAVADAHLVEARSYAARQGQTLESLSQGVRGGELLYVIPAVPLGPCGWYPDARFTTGVA